mgnify:CR=1 FL=1
MFISIDDYLYNKCLLRCEKTKFKKGTLHYKDCNNTAKKIKVIYSNNKLYLYNPKIIYGKEIIPRSLLLNKICSLISEISII